MMYVFPILAVLYGAIINRWAMKFQLVVVAIILIFISLTINSSRITFVNFLLPVYDSDFTMAAHQSVDLINYLNKELRINEPNYLLYNSGSGLSAYIVENYKHLFFETREFGVRDTFIQEFDGEQLLNIMSLMNITHIQYSKTGDDYWRDFYCPYNKNGMCFRSKKRENFKALLPYLELVFESSETDSKIYKIKYEE